MAECIHGHERLGPMNGCPRCDEDRPDLELDRCPSCNSLGTWGIRSHPKYSAKVAIIIDGELDMTAFYAHDAHAIWSLVDGLKGVADVLAVEHFDGSEWAEIHRANT